jgi:hypothetical protein
MRPSGASAKLSKRWLVGVSSGTIRRGAEKVRPSSMECASSCVPL